MVTGAVALAEFAHVVAAKYADPVALHTDHCQKDKLDSYVRPLHRDLAGARRRTARTRCSSRTCGTARRSSSRRTSQIAPSCSRRRLRRRSSSSSRSASSAARRTASTAATTTRSCTRPPATRCAPPSVLGTGEKGRYLLAATFGNVHGVYKPGNVKLRPEILKEIQDAVGARRPARTSRSTWCSTAGRARSWRRSARPSRYGVVKMNVDTDTQYAFTRADRRAHVQQLRRRAQDRRRGRQQEGLRPALLPQGWPRSAWPPGSSRPARRCSRRARPRPDSWARRAQSTP